MDEKSSNWDDFALFLAVARAGGLSGAVRDTGRSAATLGRRMHQLERRLGQDLFIRQDRGYALTAQGHALLADLGPIEARLLRLGAREEAGRIPRVKLSAGTWTTLFLLDNLDALQGTPADVQLRFVSSEAVLDIAHRDVAIGFRNQRPTGSGLAGRALARVDFALYGTAQAPDLWIKLQAATPSARWVAQHAAAQTLCEVTAPRNCLDLALAGKGIAVLPTFIGERHPALIRQSPVIAELSHDQWLVTHDDDRHLPQVRRTIDRIGALLGAGYGA
ncbi:DNA-binding transcriptional activator GcvA [Aquimixticola soesokkakensis]|uniref:DNA-binding transcriptional activator GcvA n=1 Tax=Aquimixticola soesokkakensis TaxID=1519096 RepID=A0A1Y5S0S7_9RHOB|nr:LysR family transcriptional regulator [Aquimixticola soesokkakensis]SLN30050.1 DNA-binding transcriptional activator GcvA [Aquimixticola soesokkakensis]